MLAVRAYKNALVAALLADPNVSARLGARIFDEAPRDARGDLSDVAQSPWAFVGPIAFNRVESDCGIGWRLRLRFYIASTAFGRDEAWEAAEAVYSALDLQVLSLASPYVQSESSIVTLGGDVVDPIAPKLVYFDIDAVVS